MVIDLSTKTDQKIDTLILNQECNNARDKPIYLLLLQERARRVQARSRLNFEKSMALLRQAAVDQTCVSYGQIAAASGLEWKIARHQMNGPKGHLDSLLDLCHTAGLPMLPAICVNKENIKTGELETSALVGFADGARRLGYSVHNEREFHRARREECWTWGRSQRQS